MAGTWEEGVHRAPLFGLPTPEQWGSWRPATRTSMPAPSQAPTEVGASTTAHQEGLPAAAPKRWVAACFTFCSVPALPGAKSRAPLCRAVSRAVGAERTPPAPPPRSGSCRSPAPRLPPSPCRDSTRFFAVVSVCSWCAHDIRDMKINVVKLSRRVSAAPYT